MRSRRNGSWIAGNDLYDRIGTNAFDLNGSVRRPIDSQVDKKWCEDCKKYVQYLENYELRRDRGAASMMPIYYCRECGNANVWLLPRDEFNRIYRKKPSWKQENLRKKNSKSGLSSHAVRFRKRSIE